MAKSNNPFRYFDSSPEAIRLVVMMYVRYPLSLRNVEDLLFERAIDICHETVRLWWNRFGAGSQFDPVTASGSNLTAVLSSTLYVFDQVQVQKMPLFAMWLRA